MTPATVLNAVPDMQFMNAPDVQAWICTHIDVLRRTKFESENIESFSSFELNDDFSGEGGPEVSAQWRKFFLAVLLADWACYEREVDRADCERLKSVMKDAYRYMRLWHCAMPDGSLMPVGYSGWYPIAQSVYENVLKHYAELHDRGVFVPQRVEAIHDVRYAYVFNISIIEPLRNTVCSRRMIQAFQQDAEALTQAKLMAVTVDEAGAKFSRLAGFSLVGQLTVQGEKESLYVR